MPQGAEEADGLDDVARVARDQIGHGADWIKVYADYRWGAERRGARRPSRSRSSRASSRWRDSSGRPVAAHASTAGGHAPRHRGRRRDDRARRRRHAGDLEADGRAATSASARRSRPAMRRRSTPAGRRARSPSPRGIAAKRASFKAALDAGVTHLLRQRRRRVRARRQRARARADGGLRHDARRRRARGDIGQRAPLHLDSRVGSMKAGCWPTSSPWTAIPPPISGRCGA